MVHNSLEEHLTTVCPNCGKEHNAKLFSLFHRDMHYLIGSCGGCGYRLEVRRDDLGAGLFQPNGDVTTITKVFQKSQTDHMKEHLEEVGRSRFVIPTHQANRMRFIEK
jgi:hypothetical protein